MERSDRYVPASAPSKSQAAAPNARLVRPRSLAAWVQSGGKLSRVAAVGWALRLAKTLERMHRRGMAHGGICADAVLSCTPNPTNHAELGVVELLRTPFGYFSPERLLDGRPSTVQDVWAVGVMLYFLLTGTMPFPGRTRREVRNHMGEGQPAPLADHEVCDDDLQALIDRVLAPRLPNRIVRIAALREALEGWRPELGLDSLEPLDSVDSFPEELPRPRGTNLTVRQFPPPPRLPKTGAPTSDRPSQEPSGVKRTASAPPTEDSVELEIEADDDGNDDPDTLEMEIPVRRPLAGDPTGLERELGSLAHARTEPDLPASSPSPAAEILAVAAQLSKLPPVRPEPPTSLRHALIAVGVVLCAQAVGLVLAWALLG